MLNLVSVKGKQKAWCPRYKAAIWLSSPRTLSYTRLYPLAPRIRPRLLSALKASVSSSHTTVLTPLPLPVHPCKYSPSATCPTMCDVRYCTELEMGLGKRACCTIMNTWEPIPSMHICAEHGNVHLVVPALEDRGGKIPETCCPVSLAESVSSGLSWHTQSQTIIYKVIEENNSC